jgi:hypothetical protein
MREFTAETRRSRRNTKIVLATDGAQIHTDEIQGIANCELKIAKCKLADGLLAMAFPTFGGRGL